MKVDKNNSYADRTVDIELLQSIQVPTLDLQRVYTALSKEPVRLVSGLEKCIQRYTKLVLTEIGSEKFTPDVGGSVLSEIRAGTVNSEDYLRNLFLEADKNARDVMWNDDMDERFGPQPSDEKLESTEIIDVSIDYTTQTASVSVRLTTDAGEEATFIVPVTTGIS